LRASNDSKIYFIENNQKRWIPTGEIFIANGYSWSSVNVVGASVLAQFTTGADILSLPYPNGSIVKASSSDKIYLIQNNQKRWITNIAAFLAYGLKPNSQKIISQSDLNKYTNGSDITTATPKGFKVF